MKPVIQHFFISLFTLVILFTVIFLSFSLAQDVFERPQVYFHTDIPMADIQFAIVYLALVVMSVLISYIIYLLLTSRTRTELAASWINRDLSASLEQFKKIYENAPVPYMTLNEKGEVEESNKAALRFFGVFPEEIKGKNIFSFVASEDKEHGEKLLQYYTSNIAVNREEIQMITKGGKVRSILLSIFSIRNPGSLLHTGIASIFDVTEEKELDKAKTEFVTLASHQLRTPLATAKWYTDMLLSGDLGKMTDKQKEYITTLYNVNKDMIDLVDTLLNVSRIDIGTLPVDKKETNVQQLADDVLSELSPEIGRKQIHIEKDYNASLEHIQSDPKLLRIVIQNLLTNAIKYTPNSGTVMIHFEESKNSKKIIISDTGLGIPKGQQDRIFSKLFRAENARNLTNSQGTGLGLYLVKSIMEALNGSIHFVSEDGKGSVFTVTL